MTRNEKNSTLFLLLESAAFILFIKPFTFFCRYVLFLFGYLLFPDNRCDDLSASASLSELTEIDALPSTEVQPAIGNRDGE